MPDQSILILIAITFCASIIQGGLGYGFSSFTVPLGLFYFSNKVLSPILVLIEIVANAYTVVLNWRSIKHIWKRVLPIIFGLLPGIFFGAYLLSTLHQGWLKLTTYCILLPLIISQAAGLRKKINFSKSVAVPFGSGVGLLYATTTISGPPLALLFNNQGFVKEEFRASLGLVRIIESVVTGTLYSFLGLFTAQTMSIAPWILPGVLLGLPIGIHVVKAVGPETFRRISMSFDAWIVAFGLAKTGYDLHLMSVISSWSIFLAVFAVDCALLIHYFKKNQGNAHQRTVP